MPGAISRTTGSATRWNSFHSPFIRHGSAPAADDRSVQIDGGDPEIAPRLDALHVGGDAGAGVAEQRKHILEHAAVALQRLLGDDLAQRQDFPLIMPGEVVSPA